MSEALKVSVLHGPTLTACLAFFIATNALAGPPLVTDDPGILDPGAWEVVVSVSGEDNTEGSLQLSPLLDISLGLTNNTQASVSISRLVAEPDTHSRHSGFGMATAAWKWRLVSTQEWEWAIAPNYSLPVSHEVIRPNSPEDVRTLGIPLLVSHTVADWTWMGQLGWNFDSTGDRSWDLGLAVSRPFGNDLSVMFEVFGQMAASFDEHTWNYQLGAGYAINPEFHLLAAVGSDITSRSDTGNSLNYLYFLGVQWYY